MALLSRLKIPNPLVDLHERNLISARMDYFEYFLSHRNDISSGKRNLANIKIRQAQEMGLTPEEQMAVFERLNLPIACR
jgi:hypothetical protein